MTQNKFLRIIGQFRKFTPVFIMHEQLNIENISDSIHKLTSNYFLRIEHHENKLVKNIVYDKNRKYKHKRIMHILC